MSVEVITALPNAFGSAVQHGYLHFAYMSDLFWEQMGLAAVGGSHIGPDAAHKSC